LLELILALALSALLLYAISMAVDLHLRALDVRRTNVEEAQVARAVLHMIATDLRGTVAPYRLDMTAIESLVANTVAGAGAALPTGQSSGGTSGGTTGNTSGSSSAGNSSSGSSSPPQGGAGGTSSNSGRPATGGSGSPGSSTPGQGNSGTPTGGTGGSGSRGTSNSSAASSPGTTGTQTTGGASQNSGASGSSTTGSTGSPTTESSTTGDLVSSTNVPLIVGVYGNATQLQIDVSRLPRPDQYVAIVDQSNPSMPAVPSDVKSITYFVQTPELANGQVRDVLSGSSQTPQVASGLVRRELDRSVLQYAANYGSMDSVLRTGELIAPEVIGIQFQYFDGAAWLTEWDSEQMGGLPVAIEVVVLIQPHAPTSAFSLLGLGASVPQTTEPIPYRLMVHLPLSSVQLNADNSMQEGLQNLGL